MTSGQRIIRVVVVVVVDIIVADIVVVVCYVRSVLSCGEHRVLE